MKIYTVGAVAAIVVGLVLLAMAPGKTRAILAAKEEVRSKSQAMMDAKGQREGRSYGRFEDDVLGKAATAIVAVDIFVYYSLPAGSILAGVVLLLIGRRKTMLASREPATTYPQHQERR